MYSFFGNRSSKWDFIECLYRKELEDLFCAVSIYTYILINSDRFLTYISLELCVVLSFKMLKAAVSEEICRIILVTIS